MAEGNASVIMDTKCQASSRSGFTFLEILVSMLIVGVLASVVGLSVFNHYRKSKVTAAQLQLKTFKAALNIYRGDHGVVPTERQGLDALVAKPTFAPVPSRYPDEGYLDASTVPPDPWGRDYVYLVPGRDNAAFEVLSYGSDGDEGGDDDAADLSSLDL